MANHIFSRRDLEEIFQRVVGLTLGEVDSNNVFKKTLVNPKVTGIAGDVVEQSILGYPADNKQEADLVVDGEKVELKTTGLKRAKKGKSILEAKEPMSITAVSPNRIVNEVFRESALMHKLERMLLVYYLYDSDETVEASEYARFPIQSYQFHSFSEDDLEIIQNDWELVRDFIRDAIDECDDPTIRYPEISKLRESMLYMDTAPKYPNPPRFRLKRSVVSTIAQKHLGMDFEVLDGKKIRGYTDLYEILHAFTMKYREKCLEYIVADLGFELKRCPMGFVSKSVTERVLTAAFGAQSGHLKDIEIFAKVGIMPKTITISPSGARTEDTKLDPIDFNEWTDSSICFEDSKVYNYFANQTMLFSIFQEPHIKSSLEKNLFMGFKRLTFSDEFINTHVKSTWDKVRELVNSNSLVISEKISKYGSPRINRVGTKVEATNFPKAKDYVIFLRGTGQDSTNKTLSINGFHMYPQNFWIKGKMLVEMLSRIDFI